MSDQITVDDQTAFTLGQFREQTKDIPDDTPILCIAIQKPGQILVYQPFGINPVTTPEQDGAGREFHMIYVVLDRLEGSKSGPRLFDPPGPDEEAP